MLVEIPNLYENFKCCACENKGEILYLATIYCKRCWDWVGFLKEPCPMEYDPLYKREMPRTMQMLSRYLEKLKTGVGVEQNAAI